MTGSVTFTTIILIAVSAAGLARNESLSYIVTLVASPAHQRIPPSYIRFDSRMGDVTLVRIAR